MSKTTHIPSWRLREKLGSEEGAGVSDAWAISRIVYEWFFWDERSPVGGSVIELRGRFVYGWWWCWKLGRWWRRRGIARRWRRRFGGRICSLFLLVFRLFLLVTWAGHLNGVEITDIRRA